MWTVYRAGTGGGTAAALRLAQVENKPMTAKTIPATAPHRGSRPRLSSQAKLGCRDGIGKDRKNMECGKS
jgi:hypothetical protein